VSEYRGDDSDIVELMRENDALRAKLAAAEAALAAMTAERDELRQLRDGESKMFEIVMHERNAARARAERLAEALRPFAEFAEAWDTGGTVRTGTGKIIPIKGGSGIPDDNIIARARSGNIEPDIFITLGNCRAARAVLAEMGNGGVEGGQI